MKAVKYFDMAMWPCYVGFTSSEVAFGREVKRLGNPGHEFLTGSGAGATAHSFSHSELGLTVIIALNKSRKVTAIQRAAVIAHEAVHAAQFIFEWFGEENPGKETEAYLVQYVTQKCLLAYQAGH